jgi:hypothetical protein
MTARFVYILAEFGQGPSPWAGAGESWWCEGRVAPRCEPAFSEEKPMPGAIDNQTKDKIVLILVGVAIVITVFAFFFTDGTFR